MKIITRKENMVYRELKYMQMDMNTAVSEEMLRRNLDLPEHEYHEIALNLERKGLVSRDNGKIQVENLDEEIKVMETQSEVREAELNHVEEEALRLIEEISADGAVPRYILEGHLLYGPLKLSTRRMYSIIVSLENKGLIRRTLREDGEYYLISEPQASK
ncbi:MAG: hypothetical protein QMC92_05150 [Methanothermobacter wolfeii]|nr:hypothetical protein [Methanothermobacter wolfeii]